MANNVFVPITGQISTLPTSAAAQAVTSASAPLAGATSLGLIGEDGVSISTDRSIEDIRAFQYGAVVRRTVTEASVDITVPLLEDLAAHDRIVFGSERDVDGTIAWYPGKIIETPLVFEMVDTAFQGNKTKIKRFVFPYVTVEEVGEISATFGTAALREVTFRAQLDPTTGIVGRIFEEVVDNGDDEEPPSGQSVNLVLRANGELLASNIDVDGSLSIPLVIDVTPPTSADIVEELTAIVTMYYEVDTDIIEVGQKTVTWDVSLIDTQYFNCSVAPEHRAGDSEGKFYLAFNIQNEEGVLSDGTPYIAVGA